MVGLSAQQRNDQLKRWFGDHKDYLDDCRDNDFVVEVLKPFKAADREEAMKYAIEKLG